MKKMTIDDVPGLLRREIEALCIKPFLDAFAEEIGKEKTMEIAGRVIDALAREAGRQFAEQIDGDMLAAVRDQLLSHNTAGDCDNRLREQSDDHVTVDTVDCEYVRMYERIGMRDLGYLLSCRRDVGYYDGIDSRMHLVREGTKMQGAPICDFRVEMNKKQ